MEGVCLEAWLGGANNFLFVLRSIEGRFPGNPPFSNQRHGRHGSHCGLGTRAPTVVLHSKDYPTASLLASTSLPYLQWLEKWYRPKSWPKVYTYICWFILNNPSNCRKTLRGVWPYTSHLDVLFCKNSFCETNFTETRRSWKSSECCS